MWLYCAYDGLTAAMEFVSVFQELEAIKARVREMEEEAEKLKELQNEVEKQMNLSPPPGAFFFVLFLRDEDLVFLHICPHFLSLSFSLQSNFPMEEEYQNLEVIILLAFVHT